MYTKAWNGNDLGALALHDELLHLLVGRFGEVEMPVYAPQVVDLQPDAGTYRSDQFRVDMCVVDGGPEEQATYEPADEVQGRIFTSFVGGSFTVPPTRSSASTRPRCAGALDHAGRRARR
ncbi:hypothetical protein GCM10009827_119230 [Dactylosporangium maewongense]|uniref:Uncharacterized protein n=1 Tax=Dactylosporangium maewongense TaxID=634393 RepID=A0ABP4PDU7_9ACTN